MLDDAELLRQYAAERSEAAFTEFVRRHMDFVYAAALRQLGGDAHHAADVSQYVFNEAARSARALAKHAALKGWLYCTARNASANIVRAERRRQVHEREAHTMQELTRPEATANSAELQPLIDQALDALNEREREAVFLRFFEDRGYPEIGARFAVTADAARLRIDRALERMKVSLSRRGVASTAALTGALTAQAAVLAPSGLAGSVASAVLTGTTAGGTASALIFFNFMSTSKTVIGIASVLVAVVIGTAIHQAKAPREMADVAVASPLARDSVLEHGAGVEKRTPETIVPKTSLPAPAVSSGAQEAGAPAGNRPMQKQEAAGQVSQNPAVQQWLAAVNDPKVIQDQIAQARVMTLQRYAILYGELNLDADQKEALTKLFIDKRHAAIDLAVAMVQEDTDPRADLDAFQSRVAAAKQGIDGEIHTLLGDDGFNRYQTYNQQMGIAVVFVRLQEALGNGENALSLKQNNDLRQFLRTNTFDGFPTSEVIGAAQNFLTPVQIQALQQAVATEDSIGRARIEEALPPK